MTKQSIPSVKTGKQVQLEPGMIIASEQTGAKSPLVVWQSRTAVMGDTDLIEFRVAGKDHVALSRAYTAFQLERHGYKVTGKVKTMPKIKEPDSKLVVELVDVATGPGKGEAQAVVKRIANTAKADNAPQTAQKALSGADPDTDKDTAEKARISNLGADSGGSGDADGGDKPTIEDVRPVLDAWAYGVEPEDMDEIKAKLKGWGVDIKQLAEQIDAVLDKAAAKVIKVKGK